MTEKSEKGSAVKRTVDGNTDGRYGNHSVTVTAIESNLRWEETQGRTVHIEKIIVYNRADTDGYGLNNFILKILDENCKLVFE